MHQLLGANDFAAEGGANRLVPEADTQYRQLAGEVLDCGHRNAGLRRRAGSRRDHQAVDASRHALGYAFHGDFVVAKHLDLRPQLAQVLNDVVSKAVVVVDHQQSDFARHDGHSSPSSTSSLARSSARALASVSRHSSSGTESATTPAAACTYRVWSLMMPVRIAIATSMSPA